MSISLANKSGKPWFLSPLNLTIGLLQRVIASAHIPRGQITLKQLSFACSPKLRLQDTAFNRIQIQSLESVYKRLHKMKGCFSSQCTKGLNDLFMRHTSHYVWLYIVGQALPPKLVIVNDPTLFWWFNLHGSYTYFSGTIEEFFEDFSEKKIYKIAVSDYYRDTTAICCVNYKHCQSLLDRT